MSPPGCPANTPTCGSTNLEFVKSGPGAELDQHREVVRKRNRVQRHGSSAETLSGTLLASSTHMITNLTAPDLTLVLIALVLGLGSALIGLLAQMTPQLQRKRVPSRRRD